MNNKTNKVIAWWYSIAQGFSTGCSTLVSMMAASKNFTISVIIGGIAFFADTIASLTFQGKAIQEHSNLYIPINEHSIEEQKITGLRTRCNTVLSITAQLGYMTLDAGKTIANRYFLLSTIYTLLNKDGKNEDNIYLSTGLILLLASGILIKQAFNMTNETYEATKAIAERITQDSLQEPFYRKLFFLLSKSNNATKFFRLAGSIDHTLWDDLAPWVALLPKEAIIYFSAHRAARYTVISLATIVGAPLAVLIFFQTYLFEGKHTVENLKKINFELAKTSSMDIPQKLGEVFRIPLKLAKLLISTIGIMAPIHAIASATPVFITLCNFIQNPYIKWSVSTTGGAFTLFGTSIGNEKSEVKEAKEELNEIIINFSQ